MGKETSPKGAEAGSDRFRAIQGYEIAEAGTFRGPKVPGQGQGGCKVKFRWHRSVSMVA